MRERIMDDSFAMGDLLATAGESGQENNLGDSAVTRSYAQILDMVLSFRLKPGERVNESELSRHLGVSRTPLREALNRLVTEGILISRPTKGFFCRQISADEIFQLYQLRTAIEVGGIKLAVKRVTDKELDEFEAFMTESRKAQEATPRTQLSLDEVFHERLLGLSGNQEMVSALRSVNRKIRSVRFIDLGRMGRTETQREHSEILALLRQRDAKQCAHALEEHISQRLDQIDSAIREVYGRIYGGPPLPSLEFGG